MEIILDTAIGKIKDLWREYFQWKVFKRMPMWAQVIMGILMLPIFLPALAVTFLHYVYFFCFYVFSTPVRSLHKIIKVEGKEIHFVSQAIIYLMCFPLVFFLYFLVCIFIPLLYLTYFFTNVLAYISSLGGIKFAPLLDRDVNRFDEQNKTKLQKRVYIPYVICTLVSFILLIIFTIAGIEEELVFGISVIYTLLILFGWVFCKLEYPQISKTEVILEKKEKEEPKEASSPTPVIKENSELLEFSLKSNLKEKVIGLISLVLMIASLICLFEIKTIGGFTPLAEYEFSEVYVAIFIIGALSLIGGMIFDSINKLNKYSSYAYIGGAVASFVSLLFVMISTFSYISKYSNTWILGDSVVFVFIFAIGAFGCSLTSAILSLLNWTKR